MITNAAAKSHHGNSETCIRWCLFCTISFRHLSSMVIRLLRLVLLMLLRDIAVLIIEQASCLEHRGELDCRWLYDITLFHQDVDLRRSCVSLQYVGTALGYRFY